MLVIDRQARLSTKVRQDLIGRSKQGIWAHSVCVILVLATTGLRVRAPGLSYAFAGCVLALSALRLGFVHYRSAALETSQSWHLVHVGLMLSIAAVWGITPGVALWKFGYQDKDVLMVLLYHGVVAFATVNLLVNDRRLIAIAMFLLFTPLFVGTLLHHGPGPLNYLGAAVAYLLYCLLQGRKLHELYQSQISDNYELSIAAYQDCLTGLPNRLFMNQALESCFEEAQERRKQIALLYIDLDGFKLINDSHSHKVGDLFLCEAASRIRQTLSKSEVAARIGGDEFNILVPDCTSEQAALDLANRVMLEARKPVYINGQELRYSASIGVSFFPHTAKTQEMLVRSADEAMYSAKQSGKDCVCIALPGGNMQLAHTQTSRWICDPMQLMH